MTPIPSSLSRPYSSPIIAMVPSRDVETVQPMAARLILNRKTATGTPKIAVPMLPNSCRIKASAVPPSLPSV